jgi:flagellar motor protein MotB
MQRRPKVFIQPPRQTVMQLFATVMLVVLSFFIVLVSKGVMDNKLKKLALSSVVAAFAHDEAPDEPAGSAVDIDALQLKLRQGGLLGGAAVSQGRMGAVITLRADLLFEPGSATLNRQAGQAIDRLGRALLAVPNQLIVAGHTDSVPIEGGAFGSNWNLSAERSLSVLRRLQAGGIPAERLTAYGLGSQHPLTSNADAAGRRLNNRVEILVVGDLPGEKLKGVAPAEKPADDSIMYRGYRFRLEGD